jgi:hypothetical protein
LKSCPARTPFFALVHCTILSDGCSCKGARKARKNVDRSFWIGGKERSADWITGQRVIGVPPPPCYQSTGADSGGITCENVSYSFPLVPSDPYETPPTGLSAVGKSYVEIGLRSMIFPLNRAVITVTFSCRRHPVLMA